ncbi:MAG: hypothetical protein KF791_18970 [Verrucomicrobiae bacterium]|nr:hypothetical protein [Verrucomicrobiae bacterium]
MVTFETPVTGASGLLRMRMWIDGGAGGTGTFEPDQDAWAAYDFPLDTGGKPVVELTASPDVADDKKPGSSNRATIRVRRTPWNAQSLALNVKISLRVGNLIKPGTMQDLAATYGTGANADYYLISGTGVWTPGTGTIMTTGTIQIPAGQPEGTVVVVPLLDNFTEQNFIDCNLEESSDPVGGYAPGASQRARVLIYDGPLWTAFELLTGTSLPTAAPPAITAVNAGVVGSGSWTVQPQAVGRMAWHNVYGVLEEHGALWQPSGTAAMDYGTSFKPNGISFRATASAKAGVVGSLGSSAYGILSDNTGGGVLPNPNGYGNPSVALGIDPAGLTIVGFSTSGTRKKPTRWIKGTSFAQSTGTDLSTGLSSSSVADGEALSINDSGVIVGWCSGFQGNTGVKRPFRTTAGGQIDDSSWLSTPDQNSPEGQVTSTAVPWQAFYKWNRSEIVGDFAAGVRNDFQDCPVRLRG